MSKLFKIKSQIKSYEISFDETFSSRDTFLDKNFFLIIDENVHNLYPQIKAANILVIPANENSKTLDMVSFIIEKLRSLGANRSDKIIAIGGGIIQDLVTFVSSIYMRGIDWIYYPTTLLGMVDSCLGGKSSINVANYKNIIGNFYPPNQIIIDQNFTKTLHEEDNLSGLFEAIKICFAGGESAFNQFVLLSNNKEINSNALLDLIYLSLETKKKFVEEDEFDEGKRLILNFGHTFGHAIEASSEYSISHGLAVGVGMSMAIIFSRNFSNNKTSIKIEILLNHLIKLLKTNVNLINKLKNINFDILYEKIKADKKHKENFYVFILPNEDGDLKIVHIARDEKFKAIFYKSWTEVLNSYEI